MESTVQGDTLRQRISVVAVIVVIAVNALASALPINNQTTGEISDRFDVLFVPAGYVFSIWGLIYLGLVAFAIFQALRSQRDNPRLRSIGYLFVLSSLANVTWIFLWHYEQFPLTLLAMLVLLLSLIAIYLRLGIGRTRVTAAETWLVRVPFSLYLGWITVATIANVTTTLDYLGWDGWGIAPVAFAIIMLLAGTAIASKVSLDRGDIAYMLVIIWAFAGIAVKQGATLEVAIAAWLMAGVTAVVTVIGALRHRQLERPIAPIG